MFNGQRDKLRGATNTSFPNSSSSSLLKDGETGKEDMNLKRISIFGKKIFIKLIKYLLSARANSLFFVLLDNDPLLFAHYNNR